MSESERTGSSVSFRLWRDRNFLSLMCGTLFSVIGDGSYFIVLGWFVLSVTGSEFALGTTLTFASIPRIVFMLLGGAVADRIDRKLVLVTSLLFRAVILGCFVAELFGMHEKPALWLIDMMAVFFGTIDAFYYPANSSVVPVAVPSWVLDRANSLVQTVQQMSTVLGPLLAAGLLWMHGYPSMFGTIAVIFAVSSVILSFLRLRIGEQVLAQRQQNESSSIWKDIVEGIRFVLTVRILILVMVVTLGINLLFMGPINIGIPIFVKSMGWSGSTYGGYESGFGIGTVVGGVLVSVLRGFRGKFLWLGALGAMMGIAMAGIGFVHVSWGGIVLMGIMGVAVSVVDIPFITYIQTIVPPDKLGRTMSLLTMMSVGLVPVSYAASSFVLQQHQISTQGLLLGCGIAVAVLFGALYLFRDFRQVESHPLWNVKTNEGMGNVTG
ncbi:MFS transporter [Alicyclobacillus sp. ALC3]|nr:MFS transporter [Alicyclobacillus sp. ALC3]